MAFVLPSVHDKYRTTRSGTKVWIGQVIIYDGDKPPRVIAEVRGESLAKMRSRKHAVYKCLDAIEKAKSKKCGK